MSFQEENPVGATGGGLAGVPHWTVTVLHASGQSFTSGLTEDGGGATRALGFGVDRLRGGAGWGDEGLTLCCWGVVLV